MLPATWLCKNELKGATCKGTGFKCSLKGFNGMRTPFGGEKLLSLTARHSTNAQSLVLAKKKKRHGTKNRDCAEIFGQLDIVGSYWGKLHN